MYIKINAHFITKKNQCRTCPKNISLFPGAHLSRTCSYFCKLHSLCDRTLLTNLHSLFELTSNTRISSILENALDSQSCTHFLNWQFLIAIRKCTQFSSSHSFLSFAPTSRTRTRTHISNLLNLRKYAHFSNLHSFLKLRLFNYLFKCPNTFFNSLLKMHSFLKLALTSQSRIFSITYSNALNFRVPSYSSNLHSLLELALISQTCTLSIPFIK